MLSLTRLLLLALLCVFGNGAQAKDNVSGPPEGDGPVIVDIGFLLSNINAIYEEDETFDFEGVLSMHWKDPRLAYDPAETGYDQLYYQGDYEFSEVFNGWWPQVFLANEAGRFDREGVMLRITPEGDVYYTEEIDAIAKSSLALARYPFDEQQLVAIFEVLGLDKNQVVLRADPGTSGIWEDEHHQVRVPQWGPPQLSTSVVEYAPVYLDGGDEHVTAFRMQVDIKRDSLYTLRLVALPVVIFVFMSWSVFWMDRSSLGDRMSVSFVGILTAVAYQITLAGIVPSVSYLTLMHGFLNLSFLMMCATVAINLYVGGADMHGHQHGDAIDRRCRWIFPLTFLGLNILWLAVIFLFF